MNLNLKVDYEDEKGYLIYHVRKKNMMIDNTHTNSQS